MRKLDTARLAALAAATTVLLSVTSLTAHSQRATQPSPSNQQRVAPAAVAAPAKPQRMPDSEIKANAAAVTAQKKAQQDHINKMKEAALQHAIDERAAANKKAEQRAKSKDQMKAAQDSKKSRMSRQEKVSEQKKKMQEAADKAQQKDAGAGKDEATRRP